MTMADEDWFRANFPDAHIARMQAPIKVQGIASKSHTSNLYTIARITMPAARGKERMHIELERKSTW